MKVLIACEESQEVCKAFRERGHEAYSCDIQDCSGGHPEWHIKQDVIPLLDEEWDMIIAHPPCTFMSRAGACRMYPHVGVVNKERLNKAIKAKEFFMKFYNCNCEKVAIENPLPLKIIGLPDPSQIIQPWMFGDPYSKKTYLWLKGLPPLFPTDLIANYRPYLPSNTGGAKRGQKHTKGIAHDAKTASKTFPGIAKAMAEQWGNLE